MSKVLRPKPRPILGAAAGPVVSSVALDVSGLPLSNMTTTGGWDGSGGASGANYYIPIACEEGTEIAFELEWDDTTSSVSAAVFQTTCRPGENMPGGVSDYDETSQAWQTDSDVSITGPAGAAAGGEVIQISDFAPPRGRIKLTVDANTKIRCWQSEKD